MRKIVVVPYENHWGEKFQIESQRLKAAMPEHVKVHHIGSTSVPGLAAKPIVDMIMEVENIESVDHWNECFQQLGYIVKGENGIPELYPESWTLKKSPCFGVFVYLYTHS
ncbi:GrpB family protein, partial [Bacillus cereus group sp. N21]|uniref:GrpB family protein n=1 Tax=Bacillus cereus group sp. N21 TaxID=2794591 RepID=UPI001F5BB526